MTLDGADKGVVTGFAESRAAGQVLFEASDLTKGQHTLTLTKRSGEYMLVDTFGVLTK